MNQTVLDVRNLSGSFFTSVGEIKAVQNVSFHLTQGEVLAIVGESGCGKSVTVKSIMQLIPSPPFRIKEGEILYKGKNLVTLSDKEMQAYRGKEFSMIFQDPMTCLNPTMKVGRQIAEGIVRHQGVNWAEARALAVKTMHMCGIPNADESYNRYPHTYSGGMRQRIMIAMALALTPCILFADEPTTALDVTMQAQILSLISDLRQELGTAVVLITHDLGVVAQMADRVIVMYAGQIVETGAARDVFYHALHPYTWGLLGSVPGKGEKGRRVLASIPGSPPDLFAPPEGCAFAARCAFCMPACRKVAPPMLIGDEGHAARCWLMDRRAPKATPPAHVRERSGREGASHADA